MTESAKWCEYPSDPVVTEFMRRVSELSGPSRASADPDHITPGMMPLAFIKRALTLGLVRLVSARVARNMAVMGCSDPLAFTAYTRFLKELRLSGWSRRGRTRVATSLYALRARAVSPSALRMMDANIASAIKLQELNVTAP